MNPTKPHILILASWYPNRYTPFNGDFVQRIAEETSKRYNVTVLHICNKQESGESELIVNKRSDSLEEWIYYQKTAPQFLRLPSFLSAGTKLFKQIQSARGKVDFCHVQVIWKMGLLAYRLKKKYRLPYWITEHWTGYLPQHYQLDRFGLKFLSKIIARNADGFITVSENLGREIHRQGFVKKLPHVLPNVVRWTEPTNNKTNQLFTFIHLSNFRDEQKNVSGIVRAFANALQYNPDIKLILGGSDKVQPFQTLAEQLHIPADKLQFLPELPHTDALKAIAEADTLVCFSHFETFAITCAEAVCMGTPVIYTPCGAPEEYLENDMGMAVPINNEQALTEAMLAVSTGKQTFDRQHILTKARAKFGSERWLNCLTKMLFKGGGGANGG